VVDCTHWTCFAPNDLIGLREAGPSPGSPPGDSHSGLGPAQGSVILGMVVRATDRDFQPRSRTPRILRAATSALIRAHRIEVVVSAIAHPVSSARGGARTAQRLEALCPDIAQSERLDPGDGVERWLLSQSSDDEISTPHANLVVRFLSTWSSPESRSADMSGDIAFVNHGRQLDLHSVVLIHSGQTGVERGAYRAAIALGMTVGGLCSYERRDELGRLPEGVAEQLVPHSRSGARSALLAHIPESDALIVLVPERGAHMPGIASVLTEARKRLKPFRVVDVRADWEEVSRWLSHVSVALARPRLMVTGPRQTRWSDGERYGYLALKAMAGSY
jgi:Tfp pilus assembly protein FimT